MDGITTSAQRWLTELFFQGLVVVAIGLLLPIILAACWTGTTTYSFGHDTVLLATLIRRFLARLVDLFLIGGPLTLQALYLFQFEYNAAIFSVIEAAIEGRKPLAPLIPAVIWIGPAWLALIVSAGICGYTPGKWLCGIRVLRTTLRPCGVLRSLLRELLLWIDVPQGVTAIPAVICLIATQNRQRIGDLAADTIVTMRPRP
jgi:uncharacterized RDD family membrane protein YckC